MRSLSALAAAALLVSALPWLATAARAQPVAADVLLKASNNCLTSVARVVGRPRSTLRVIRQTSEASGLHVEVKVPEATAAWACLTDRQGKVQDVHFTGSEGAL